MSMCYIRVKEGKIENLKKEGKMRISTLLFIYTIVYTLAYLKVYRKFHNPKSKLVAEKILKKNVHMCYIGVTERKIEKKAK